MKAINSILALSLIFAASCSPAKKGEENITKQECLTEYVNPLVGSGGHGHGRLNTGLGVAAAAGAQGGQHGRRQQKSQ